MANRLSLFSFVFFLIPFIIEGCSSTASRKEIPEFSISLIDSNKIFHSNEIPLGKPFVFFYFGPYCDHSRDQMNNIIKDMDRLKDVNFYLITPEPHDDMMRFYRYFKLNQYSNIIVGRDYKSFFEKHFHVENYPYIQIYNKKGTLTNVFKGNIYGREILKSTQQKI